MNDRIRQLLLDSGGQYSSGNQNDWPSWVLGDAVVTKFAELIVKECIGICNQAILQNQDTLSKLNEDELAEKMAIHGAILQAQKLGNGINEHFGIDCYTQEDLDQAHERGIELANKLRVE
jgi:hypothetical protein